MSCYSHYVNYSYSFTRFGEIEQDNLYKYILMTLLMLHYWRIFTCIVLVCLSYTVIYNYTFDMIGLQ